MTTKYLGVVDGHSGGSVVAEYRQIGDSSPLISKESFKAYYVLADIGDTEDVVLANSSIPAYSMTADSVNGYLIRKSAKEISTVVLGGTTKILWVVECHFGTAGYQYLKRRWYTEIENELQTVDQNGDFIATVNGEPLNAEWPVANIMLEIEQMVVGPADPIELYGYINHVNNATFYGVPLGCALVQDIKVDEDFSRAWLASGTNPCADIISHVVIVIKMRIKFDDDQNMIADTLGKVKLLHEGYLVLPGDILGPSAGVPAAVRPEKNGQAVKANIVSAGPYAGMDLRLASSFSGGPANVPQFLTFQKFPYADFSDLGLEFCMNPSVTTTTTT